MARVKALAPAERSFGKAGNGGRLRVFISYSRRDLGFVDKLVQALEDREIDVIIDKRDLPLAVEFKNELQGFVREADAVVCVVSPTSMASPWCAWEIEQVGVHNKRLVPVVVEAVADEQVPEAIRKINYVFFTGDAQAGDGFGRRADELAQALKLDLPWLKEHTRIEALAHHWSQNGSPRALLMRGPALDAAEAWRARQPAEAPPLTPLHRTYLLASRADATRAQRVLVAGSVAGTVFALVLSALALWQRHEAVDNARLATTNEVRALAELAHAEAGRGETTRAIASALQGFDKAAPVGVDTAEVETALYQAVWQQRELRRLKLAGPVESAWFDPASGAVNVLTRDSVLRFDGELQPQGSRPRPPPAQGATDAADAAASPRPVLKPLPAALSLSPDGQAMLATRPATKDMVAVERRVPLASLGFRPSQAWWSLDATADKAVLILARGGLAEGESEDRQIAVANARDVVARLDTTNQHVDIDPSGRLVLLCAGWGSVSLVRADDPQTRFTTHTYYKNSGCEGIASEVRYSASEDVVAFIPSSNSGVIEQPVLVSADKGIRLAALGGHTSSVVAIDISPDGHRVLTLTEDGTLRLWQLRARADPALVKQAGGMVLSGRYGEPPAGAPLPADYTSEAYIALLGPQGSLARQATGRQLLARPGGKLLLVAGAGELLAFDAGNLATPRWRKPLAAALVDAVHTEGDAVFFTADEAGQVWRWAVADGTSSIVTRTATAPTGAATRTATRNGHEAIVRLQLVPPAAPGLQRLWVLTSHRLLTVDASDGQAVGTVELSTTGKVQQGQLAEGYLSYCLDADLKAPDCVLMPLDGGATTVTARMPCQQPLRTDKALGLVYCPMLLEALPKIVDLAQPARPFSVFPDANTVQATGLRSAAALGVAALPGCRRGFVNLGGGIPDDMYRGEGLLYDFAAAREVVRTKGDASPDYVGYGEGEGLPVFCDGAALAGYARGLLKQVSAGKP